MSGFGGGKVGRLGFGGQAAAPSPLTILSIVAIAENVVRITFAVLPYFSGLLDQYDASLASCYSFTPLASTGRDGNAARPVSALFAVVGAVENSIEVTLDRPMTPDPAQYQVAITGTADAGTLTPIKTLIANFGAVARVFVPPQTDTAAAASKDFSNPSTLADLQSSTVGLVVPQVSPLGTYPVDDSGDYAIDQGLTSYKKRILRRCITRKNGFAFMPGYGVGIPQLGKRLQKSTVSGKVAADAQAQIGQEPETAAVSCTFAPSASNPGLTYLKIKAQTRNGKPVNYAIPFATT